MSSLPVGLISQFAKVTKGETPKKNETTVYGTVVEYGGSNYVRLDGSDLLTPVTTTVDVKADDRVTILLKNHTATVTGNITSPAARNETVNVIVNNIKDMDKVLADVVTTSDLDAANAKISKLEAADVTINNKLTANSADIETLKATDVTVSETLTANKADIDTLKAADVTITERLDANEAAIKDLKVDTLDAGTIQATYATIASLNATNANVSNLTADVADIDTLIFGSASGDVIQTSFSNAVIAQLGDAQIKSAMIENVSADKIVAGDIITNNVRVKSEDGSLLISDETMQISDGTRVRVQIGKDTANDYSINIWDQNGELMFSKGGITDNAIKEAIIRNDMVSDTANIAAHKLDIDSLFEEINGSTNTIKSTQIYLDDENQTLDVAFKSLSTTVTDQGETITSQGTAISTIQGQITSKIWQQDIDIASNEMSTQYSTLEQTVEGVSSTVASHTATLDSMTIGGRNLVRSSRLEGEIDESMWNGEYNVTASDDGIEFVRDTAGDARLFFTQPQDLNPLLTNPEFGDFYTLSADFRTVEGVSVPDRTAIVWRLTFTDGTYTELNLEPDPTEITSEWIRFHTTAIVTISEGKTLGDYAHVTAALGENAGGFAFRHIKLEKGSMPTEWTPAPEDDESKISGLVSRVSSAETQIIQNTEAIKLTATSTEVATAKQEAIDAAETSMTETLSSYSTTTEMNATIQLQSDNILSTVSSTYATQASLNDLEIGGRNLIRDSKLDAASDHWSRGSLTVDYSNGYAELTKEETTSRGFYNQTGVELPETDQIYTLSMEVKKISGVDIPENTSFLVRYVFESGTFVELSVAIPTDISEDSWTKLSKTMTFVRETPVSVQCTVAVGTAAGGVACRRIKYEKGDKATDWTPAPEDLATVETVDGIDARLLSAESSITQLSDKITANVTETTNLGTRTSTLEQTASGLTTRITNTENDVSEAAKTATDFLQFSDSGLIVGDMTADTLGKNVLIDSDSVDIRNNDTILASFGANTVTLGRNAEDSVIDLCDGAGRISANTAEAATSYPNRNAILIDSQEIETESVRFVASTSNEYGASSTPAIVRGTELYMTRSGGSAESCARLKAEHKTTSSGAYTNAGISAMTYDSASTTRAMVYASDSANSVYNQLNVYPTKTTMNKNLVLNGTTFTGENKVLWTGGYYMSDSQTATLSEAISAQANGIVLVWSYYTDGASQNQSFNMTFIPKHFITLHAGKGVSAIVSTGTLGTVAGKYVYISDTSITGYAGNDDAATAKDSGITSTTKNFVLRYVIGV